MGAKLKREFTEFVAWTVKGKPIITKQSDFTFTWFVPDKRSDPDNIAFACKFIFDGLVEGGVLPKDSMRYVKSIHHLFELGPPKVVVDIQEC